MLLTSSLLSSRAGEGWDWEKIMCLMQDPQRLRQDDMTGSYHKTVMSSRRIP